MTSTYATLACGRLPRFRLSSHLGAAGERLPNGTWRRDYVDAADHGDRGCSVQLRGHRRRDDAGGLRSRVRAGGLRDPWSDVRRRHVDTRPRRGPNRSIELRASNLAGLRTRKRSRSRSRRPTVPSSRRSLRLEATVAAPYAYDPMVVADGEVSWSAPDGAGRADASIPSTGAVRWTPTSDQVGDAERDHSRDRSRTASLRPTSRSS